jgi:hypothetical protein
MKQDVGVDISIIGPLVGSVEAPRPVAFALRKRR